MLEFANAVRGARTRARTTKAILAGSTAMLLGLTVAGAAGTVAYAADQAATSEVVITGSRIVRRDFTAPSPIVTVS